MKRVTTETNVEETVQMFQHLMEGKYIHCKRQHVKYYNCTKEKDNEIQINVEYSEN